MSFDPYATLGLPRTASSAEIKAAYRALAKRYHPDTAGQAAMPRFLAIQAAYELLTTGSTGRTIPGRSRATPSSPARSAPREPWRAEPGGTQSARQAYRDRARRAGAAQGPGPDAASGSARPRGGQPAGGGAGAAGAGPGAASSRAGTSGRPGADPPGRKRKATLGSTSYDDAAGEPMEPGWSGAGWYGVSSGTYWTMNPKEYADPRKHGPEYQARARRAAAAAAGLGGADEATEAVEGPEDDDGPEDDGAPETTGATASGPGQPSRASTTGDDDTESDEAFREAPMTDTGGHDWSAAWAARETAPSGRRPPPPATEPPFRAAPFRAAPFPPPATGGGTTYRPPRTVDPEQAIRGLDPLRAGDRGLGRVALVATAWLPIVLAIVVAAGEASGCVRSAATCNGSDIIVGWLAIAFALGLFATSMPIARVFAHGGLVAGVVAIPATVLLSISGGTVDPEGSARILLVILAAAWLVGVAIGAARVIRRREPADVTG